MSFIRVKPIALSIALVFAMLCSISIDAKSVSTNIKSNPISSMSQGCVGGVFVAGVVKNKMKMFLGCGRNSREAILNGLRQCHQYTRNCSIIESSLIRVTNRKKHSGRYIIPN